MSQFTYFLHLPDDDINSSVEFLSVDYMQSLDDKLRCRHLQPTLQRIRKLSITLALLKMNSLIVHYPKVMESVFWAALPFTKLFLNIKKLLILLWSEYHSLHIPLNGLWILSSLNGNGEGNLLHVKLKEI